VHRTDRRRRRRIPGWLTSGVAPLEAIVTDAAGHLERTSMSIYALNEGLCESPPCGH
jgi:hypothetical protein